MKVFTLIATIVSLLLMFSTAVCGLWIKFNRDKIPDLNSAVAFHMNLGITTAIFVVVTILIMAVNILKR